MDMPKRAKQLLFYAGLLALWQLVASLEIWPPYLFPTPWSVFDSLRAGFSDDSFWIGLGVSGRRLVLGYGVAVALGMSLGILMAASRLLQDTISPLVVSLQSLPSICWLPLSVLWFGLSEQAILFVIVMGSMLSITISTELGFGHIPKIYAMAGRNLGTTGIRHLVYVLLPASLPHIISGLKQGWAFAWRSLISGEMIFVSLGLGHLLMMGRDLNDMSQVVAVMVLIVVLGACVDSLLFRSLETHIRRRWGLASRA